MVINLTFPNPNLFSKNKILSASTAGTPSNDLIITIIKYKRILLIIKVFQIIEICLTKFLILLINILPQNFFFSYSIFSHPMHLP
jgi:hypothetical protein